MNRLADHMQAFSPILFTSCHLINDDEGDFCFTFQYVNHVQRMLTFSLTIFDPGDGDHYFATYLNETYTDWTADEAEDFRVMKSKLLLETKRYFLEVHGYRLPSLLHNKQIYFSDSDIIVDAEKYAKLQEKDYVFSLQPQISAFFENIKKRNFPILSAESTQWYSNDSQTYLHFLGKESLHLQEIISSYLVHSEIIYNYDVFNTLCVKCQFDFSTKQADSFSIYAYLQTEFRKLGFCVSLVSSIANH
jgi:hypothetical protein